MPPPEGPACAWRPIRQRKTTEFRTESGHGFSCTTRISDEYPSDPLQGGSSTRPLDRAAAAGCRVARCDGPRFQQTKQGLSRQQSASYQGAFEAVLAVPVAMGFGYWCDGRFDTQPIGLGIGVVVGFGAMLLRITRMRPPEHAEEEAEQEEEEESQEREQAQQPARDDESR